MDKNTEKIVKYIGWVLSMPTSQKKCNYPERMNDVEHIESSKAKKTNRIRIDAIEPEEFSGEWLEHPTATSYPNNLKEESLDGQQIVELKRGSKGRKFLPAAISNLNIQTLGYIGDIPDFRYDTKSKKFYTESSICHERTTTELNQAASALRLFEGISFDEILNLCNILYENPYFAAYTNIGKRVYQIIRDWPVSMTFDEPYYYRARIADSENELYLASDMMMPPEGIPSQGRYNEYGRSCFYFTNSLEGAVKEVAGHQGQRDKYVQIIQLKPSGNVKLIDLSKMVGTRNSFVTALRKSVSDEKAKVKKEYLLPNYVAGCCRAAGFDGIKYRGSNYKCYVLWNDTKMDIAHYLEPKRIKEYLK